MPLISARGHDLGPDGVSELSRWRFLLLSCSLPLSQSLKLLPQLVDLLSLLVLGLIWSDRLQSSNPNLSPQRWQFDGF